MSAGARGIVSKVPNPVGCTVDENGRSLTGFVQADYFHVADLRSGAIEVRLCLDHRGHRCWRSTSVRAPLLSHQAERCASPLTAHIHFPRRPQLASGHRLAITASNMLRVS